MSNTPIRNYATVLYPESAKENWKTILQDLHIKALVSPLHDKDVNDDGELKKPHYHIMYVFDGKKSERQVREINELIGSVGLERVISLKGYARYLCHLDDRDKIQYPVSEVEALGGISYEETIKETSDKYRIAKEILNYCKENEIIAYCDIVDFAMDNNDGWFVELIENPYMYKSYIKSLAWKKLHEEKEWEQGIKIK